MSRRVTQIDFIECAGCLIKINPKNLNNHVNRCPDFIAQTFAHCKNTPKNKRPCQNAYNCPAQTFQWCDGDKTIDTLEMRNQIKKAIESGTYSPHFHVELSRKSEMTNRDSETTQNNSVTL